MHNKHSISSIVPAASTRHNWGMTTYPTSTVSTGAPLHTILGAGGVIGRELSQQLSCLSKRIREVSRHPGPPHSNAELVAADLTDAKATSLAVAGSDVVYLVAGLAYNTATWQKQWPLVMRNVIGACRQHGARLVFLDNVYAYGHVEGVMTEATPFNPCSRKGEVRAAVATTLLDAMRCGEVQALIARSADFYGPGAALSFLEAVLFARLRAGKSPQWLGDPAAVHTFTFTPDIGQALAALGQCPAAFGQTWHLPTARQLDGNEVTGSALTAAACAIAAQPTRLQVPPPWLVHTMGWVIPVIRENNEMFYQLNHAYRFDGSKTEKALGWQATPYAAGLRQTMRPAN